MSSLQPQNCSLSIILKTELVIIPTSDIDTITQKYEKYFSYFCVIVSMSLVGIITNSVFNIMDREQFCGCSDDTSG